MTDGGRRNPSGTCVTRPTTRGVSDPDGSQAAISHGFAPPRKDCFRQTSCMRLGDEAVNKEGR
jgi:hypothetical protein